MGARKEAGRGMCEAVTHPDSRCGVQARRCRWAGMGGARQGGRSLHLVGRKRHVRCVTCPGEAWRPSPSSAWVAPRSLRGSWQWVWPASKLGSMAGTTLHTTTREGGSGACHSHLGASLAAHSTPRWASAAHTACVRARGRVAFTFGQVSSGVDRSGNCCMALGKHVGSSPAELHAGSFLSDCVAGCPSLAT